MAFKSIKDFPESTSPSGEWFALVDDGTGCYYKVKLKNLPGGGFTTTSSTTTNVPGTTTTTTTAAGTTSTTTTVLTTTSTTTTAVPASTTTSTTSSTSTTTTSTSSTTTSTTTTIIYDVNAQAFFTAIEGAGGSLTVNQKGAVNTLVLSMKSGGGALWTKMKAIYPFVGGTATTHKFNLKNPATYQITFAGVNTHDADGVTFNPTNGYGDTNFDIADFNSTTDISVGIYNRSIYSVSHPYGTGDFGVYASGPPFGFNAIYSYNGRYYPGGPSTGTFTNTNGQPIGCITGVIRGVADAEVYKNGVSVVVQTTNINTSVPAVSRNWFLGAVNNNAGTAYDFTGFNYAFAFLGDALSDAEMLSFYNAIQAYQTTLGRAV